MEYSLEYGFLRLSQATRQRLSIPVMVVTLGKPDPKSQGVQLLRVGLGPKDLSNCKTFPRASPSHASWGLLLSPDPTHTQIPRETSASETASAACCWMSSWVMMTSSCLA